MRDELVFVAVAGFEAARQVEILPVGHRSRRVHGHSFVAKVRARVPEAHARFPGSEVGQLQKQLSDCIAPLDYELLNNKIATPTDENVARWIRTRLDLTDIQAIGIRSTADEGVDLD